MELTPEKLISIHLIDENFLFINDIKDKYAWRPKYKVNCYPSTDKFIEEIKRASLLVKCTDIVILAVNLSTPDKQGTTRLIDKLESIISGINIIKVCHSKELDKESYAIRNDNVIHIVNNENTMLRIDNAIKWVLAKSNLNNKNRIYKFIVVLFTASLIITALGFIYLFFIY